MIKKFEILDLLTVGLFILSLGLLLFPVPPIVLDFGLVISLTMGFFILIVTLQSENFSKFSVFPTLLLLSTFFRLCLNVASTRLILTEGHRGTEAVSSVISSFSHIVSGNSVVVGFIIFLTLVLVNFIVISNGAQRVAEVAARFTLDALPGKQLSVESEFKLGHITDKEAQSKRELLERESDFYGSMDGASKFLRGDAIASLCIMALNLVGGVIIGVFQKDLSFSQASNYYAMLTIGDGLVHQIPALLASISAGLMVTGSRHSQTLFKTLKAELFQSKIMYSVAFVLFFMGLLPEAPFVLFFSMSAFIFSMAYFKKPTSEENFSTSSYKEISNGNPSTLLSEKSDFTENTSSKLKTTLIEIHLAYDWTKEVTRFTKELNSLRRELRDKLGFEIPMSQVRDNLSLKKGEIQVFLRGELIFSDKMPVNQYLLVTSETLHLEELEHRVCEKGFLGLPSYWISGSDRGNFLKSDKTRAYSSYEVLSHRLSQALLSHSHQLLTLVEAKKWIQRFQEDQGELYQEIMKEKLTFAELFEILKHTLQTQGSICEAYCLFEMLSVEGEHCSGKDLILKVKENMRQNKVTYL